MIQLDITDHKNLCITHLIDQNAENNSFEQSFSFFF